MRDIERNYSPRNLSIQIPSCLICLVLKICIHQLTRPDATQFHKSRTVLNVFASLATYALTFENSTAEPDLLVVAWIFNGLVYLEALILLVAAIRTRSQVSLTYNVLLHPCPPVMLQNVTYRQKLFTTILGLPYAPEKVENA